MQPFFTELVAIDFKNDLFRNIKTIRKAQDLFDDLSNEPEDWECAIKAEINSKPKEYLPEPIINRPFDEARFIHAIAFPFDSKNWAASRYSNGDYGVWYGAIEFITSIYETVYHWKRFIQAAQFEKVKTEIVGERRVFKVHCEALLFDLRKKKDHFPALLDKNDYTFTQEVGKYIQQQGHPGLVSQSARCEGSLSAIFTERVLSHPRDYCYLNYYFDQTKQIIRIERDIGQVLLQINL